MELLGLLLLIHSHPIGYKMFRNAMLGDMGIAWIDLMACSGDMNYLIGE
jgi:hypothetical protein